MKYLSKEKKNKQRTIFTKYIWYLAILTIVVLLIIGLPYINSVYSDEQDFFIKTISEALMTLSALLLIDFIVYNRFYLKLRHREFRNVDSNTGIRSVLILFVVVIIQIVSQMVPLTARNIDIALAIIFAAPAEELFFRALIISVFSKFGKNMDPLISIRIYYPMDDKEGLKRSWKDGKEVFYRDFSFVDAIGILISAAAFAFIHTNYYYSPNLLLAIFLGGLWLGFMYWYWRDITANIIAHLILNIIAVGQWWFLINFV